GRAGRSGRRPDSYGGLSGEERGRRRPPEADVGGLGRSYQCECTYNEAGEAIDESIQPRVRARPPLRRLVRLGRRLRRPARARFRRMPGVHEPVDPEDAECAAAEPVVRARAKGGAVAARARPDGSGDADAGAIAGAVVEE